MDRRQPATNSGRNSRSVRAIAFVCGDERTTQRGIPHCDLTDHRTEALQLSRGTADYAFMMDADDLLVGEPGLDALGADAYTMRIGTSFTY